jgi:ligand-binding sensor domain-containing protein
MRELRPVLLLALLATAAGAAPCAAGGAWTTYQRAEQYTDLLVRGDTVWCASGEAALQRFVRSTGAFEVIARRPGALASHALTALAFDRSGRLWIGTEDAGVSRLSADGSQWDLVSQLDGLPAGVVRVLRAVGDTLLIGTDHGIALWDGSEIAGTVPEGVNPSPLASDVITGLVLRGDSLWAATGAGLYVSRASTGLSSWSLADAAFAGAVMQGLGWDGVTLVAVANDSAWVFVPATASWSRRGGIGAVQRVSDHGGTILASTTLGLYQWTGSVWSVVTDAPRSYDCVPANDAFCPGVAVGAFDDAGRLWVGHRDGLHERDGGGWTLHVADAPVGNDVQNIAVQGARVYIATFDEGVGRFDGTQWRNWFSGGCSSGCDTTFRNSIYAFALLVDQQGRKWVGNWSSAIESFDDGVSPPQFVHSRPADSISVDNHTFAWSAAADSAGGRWFGMDTPGEDPIGLEYYDGLGLYRANYSPVNTPDLRSGYVRALEVDDERKNLWVGYRTYGLNVFDLPATAGGALLLAGGGSLDAFSALDVFGLALHGDSLWVMSTSDLRCLSASSFAQRGATLSLVGSPGTRGACHPLDVAPDGTAWVGTDGGVHAYATDGSVTEYTVANSPLAGNEVRAVRVDPASGVVWIGTSVGLSRFDPAYVAPPPAPLPALEVRVYPNPALLTGAGLFLRLAGNATAYAGAVYDAGGRRLHRFAGTNGGIVWDGRDASGTLVRPGIYFVRVESGGFARTLRVALLR